MTHPAAQGLADDVAVLGDLILTHDMIVEGVHYLPSDPPADIGWKLAAVNLSDLSAKGASPVGCLMGYNLSGDADWDAAFLDGLSAALEQYNMPLIGGDTVSVPAGSARQYGLTAIGRKGEQVPSRTGAQVGDMLYITGPVGLAGLGLRSLQSGETEPQAAITAYRRPLPHLEQGTALAPRVHAMMDVSDGLLLDATRMAAASGLGVTITDVPMPDIVAKAHDDPVQAAISAAIAGDDYVLLAAGPAGLAGVGGAMPIGHFTTQPGLWLVLDNKEIILPEKLGYQHD